VSRGTFDCSLDVLRNELLRMGSIVEKQIYKSVEALTKQDEKLADLVIKDDDLVDNLEKEIEDRCIKLIAREQPLANDLRNLFITTKIVTDLERMADHAVDIAKITKKLLDEEYIKKLIDIPKMAQIVQTMIKEALDVYVSGDVEKAKIVCKMDDEIDALYKQIFSELLIIMMENPRTITQATQFLFVCKFLERVGDHATNICEWTIYRVTGELVDLND
jgi:phosphate transport system protein